MSEKDWTRVDEYLAERLVPPDEALDAAFHRDHGQVAAGQRKRQRLDRLVGEKADVRQVFGGDEVFVLTAPFG